MWPLAAGHSALLPGWPLKALKALLPLLRVSPGAGRPRDDSAPVAHSALYRLSSSQLLLLVLSYYLLISEEKQLSTTVTQKDEITDTEFSSSDLSLLVSWLTKHILSKRVYNTGGP